MFFVFVIAPGGVRPPPPCVWLLSCGTSVCPGGVGGVYAPEWTPLSLEGVSTTLPFKTRSPALYTVSLRHGHGGGGDAAPQRSTRSCALLLVRSRLRHQQPPAAAALIGRARVSVTPEVLFTVVLCLSCAADYFTPARLS